MRNFWNGIEKNMNESSLGNCVQNLISGQDNIQNYLLFELVNMCISINRRAEFLNTSLLDINNYETTAALTAGVSNRLENEKFISEIENLYSDIDLNGSCCFKSVEKLDLLVSNDLNGLIACASKNMYNETPILISKYLNLLIKTMNSSLISGEIMLKLVLELSHLIDFLLNIHNLMVIFLSNYTYLKLSK